jgi:putative pyruvate formate lyase activating enzyme
MEKIFTIPRKEFEPAYLAHYKSGELQERAASSVTELASCKVCPRDCEVNRLESKTAVCKVGRFARVASYHPHFGEEDCLRGRRGSGTIFFGGCNLRCVFCQNFEISQGPSFGQEVTPFQLASIMLHLQDLGCHNINFVTPEHVVPQILEALVPAIENGLRLPLVYNTSAYDSLHSLQLLDGVVDIYMPDFKIWAEARSLRLLQARDYPSSARTALKEMHRQVGILKVDEQGLALRGVLVRHLVMPESLSDTAEIMQFLSRELSPDTYLNLMDQYYPAGKVSDDKYPEINRRLTSSEFAAALKEAKAAGLWRFDRRALRFVAW